MIVIWHEMTRVVRLLIANIKWFAWHRCFFLSGEAHQNLSRLPNKTEKYRRASEVKVQQTLEDLVIRNLSWINSSNQLLVISTFQDLAPVNETGGKMRSFPSLMHDPCGHVFMIVFILSSFLPSSALACALTAPPPWTLHLRVGTAYNSWHRRIDKSLAIPLPR